ncbi:MAG TPA: hypothetical protein VK015_04550, partial [Microbacterium sp.]|nr:hypothetical protein [Microbacterium sp.]
DDRGGDRREGGFRGSRDDNRGGDRRQGGYAGGRDDRGFDRRDERRYEERPNAPHRDHVADPELPEDITPKDLMPSARNELKTLSAENAERVARHMAMAARAIDDDPQLAHEHAQAAMRHAGRVGVVRETLAITAYATGDFALALRELRTVRRITGRNDHIAMIVDSERGVGRPEKALEEGRAVDRESLPVGQRVELAIAMSGARLDLGQTELALHELDIPEDDPNRAYEWSAGLFAARAAVLADLGREDEAAEWERRAEIAEDAIASKLAEDDTIVVSEMTIDIPDLTGQDPDAARGAETDVVDEATDADGVDDAADADDVRQDLVSGESAAVAAVADTAPQADAADAEAASRTDAAQAANVDPSSVADDASFDPAEGEPSIEDEVAQLLAEAGIVDDAPAGDDTTDDTTR